MAKLDGTSLFPILPQHPTGIARLAAEAEHADDGHLIEFKSLHVRSILNRTVSKRMLWMAWSINPYRGCEFGCRYCYARYTHEFMAPKVPVSAGGDSMGASPTTASTSAVDLRDPETFERLIFLKQNAAWLLEQELRKIDPSPRHQPATRTTQQWCRPSLGTR
jgi:DNA repair photolyase